MVSFTLLLANAKFKNLFSPSKYWGSFWDKAIRVYPFLKTHGNNFLGTKSIICFERKKKSQVLKKEINNKIWE